MGSREDLRAAAAALSGSVAVCGTGAYADSLADRVFPGARVAAVSEFAGEDPSDAAAVLVAVDPTADAAGRDDAAARDAVADALGPLAAVDAFVVAVVSADEVDADALSAIRDRADAVLLAGPEADADASATVGADDDPVETAIRRFLSIVQDPGFVNLDLTDARTVLSSGVAALGVGAAARDAPGDAVGTAFAALPEGVDAAAASAVLVDVVVDADTSIAAVTDVIGAVRERVGTDANVIWGGAVDEDATDALAVRTVVADVRYAPPLGAGDPCPRCGTALSAYEFGARETLSCDGCGYSGIAVRRE